MTAFFKSFGLYRGLPREIYLLSVACAVTSLGYFVMPFLALLLTDKLGFPPEKAGLFILCAAVAYVPGSLLGGKLCDQLGRKRLWLIAQACAASCYLVCAALGVSPLIAGLVVAAQFFGGVAHPAQQALVFDLTNKENRAAAFSLFYLAFNLGLAIGSVAAGLLYERFARLLFLVDGLTTLASLLLILLYVGDTIHLTREPTLSESSDDSERCEEGSSLSVLMRRVPLLIFVLLCALMNFIVEQHAFGLPLQLKATFPNDGARHFGSIMALNTALVLLLTTPLTALLKALSPIANLAIAAALYALGFGLLQFALPLILFFVSVAIWTLGEIIATTHSNVYIANHTPRSHRGRLSAVVRIILGLGFMLNPYFMGMFIERYSLPAVWSLTSALSLAALAGFFALGFFTRERNTVKVHQAIFHSTSRPADPPLSNR